MDFPATIAVQILPEDLRDGVRLDCRRCPVALALMRGVPPPDGLMWSVTSSSAYVQSAPDGQWTEAAYSVPRMLGMQIDDWDHPHNRLLPRAPMEPQTWVLTLRWVANRGPVGDRVGDGAQAIGPAA